MIKLHPNFKITDSELLKTKILRYMKLDQLIDLIKGEYLYFSRSDRLGEKFEGSYSKPTIDNRKIIFNTHLPKKIQSILNGIKTKNIYEEVRKCIYVCSWCADEYESSAMWKIYAEQNKGLAIETTINDLLNSLKDDKNEFLVGFIKYIDFKKDLMPEGNLFNPYFFKRKEFEFENEFRIITSKLLELNTFLGTKTPDGLKIDLDYKKLIKKIYMPPNSNKKFKDEILKIIEKYNLDCEIFYSKLDEDPLY